MSELNQHQQQLLTDAVKKLGGAMDKIKFHSAMSVDEANTIRSDIDQVRSDLFMMSDINGDVGNVELFKEAVDLTEKVLNVLTNNHEHLV